MNKSIGHVPSELCQGIFQQADSNSQLLVIKQDRSMKASTRRRHMVWQLHITHGSSCAFCADLGKPGEAWMECHGIDHSKFAVAVRCSRAHAWVI